VDIAVFYDPLGAVYQTASYIVTSGLPGSPQATNYWYDADGNQVALEDPDQNATLWTYNGMDQTTESIQGQMESGSSPWTFNQGVWGQADARR
jgi:YD repeat-containing protein